MNASGTYVVTGSFDKTMPGDKLDGLLVLKQDEGEPVPPFGMVALSVVLDTKQGTSAPCAVADLRISPAGAISFAIKPGSRPGPVWSFTGFLSAGAITGRHSLVFTPPKRTPTRGPWTGVRAQEPLAEDAAALRAIDALIATPQARRQMTAFLDKYFQWKGQQ